jgi:hypothetical protein
MPVKLIVAAADWESKQAPSTFTVQADEVFLGAQDRSKQIYEIPSGTKHVRIVATPKPTPGTTTSPYWQSIVVLNVASNGTVSPDTGFAPWVAVTPASGATAGATLATVRVSRFREVTFDVLKLLKVVPSEGGTWRQGLAPTQADLARNYGKWPPDDLDIHPLPAAHFLDVDNPVKTGGILSFVKSSVAVDADSIVLELAGGQAPRLFGVVWPDAVVRNNGAAPTRFFFYFRQSGGQDRKNVFVGGAVKGPYPYNFDYAERCLFESQHYPGTPIIVRNDWMLRPKGVPYQVARSGAKVVTVFPVASADDSISYGVLSNFDEMGRLLADLQAYMFWRVGIVAPPTTVGATALSGFSSVNIWLAGLKSERRLGWLDSNRASSFLKNNIRAIHFLDPPNVDDCVGAGLRWRKNMGNDKRVRLYSARDETKFFPAYRTLLGLGAADPLPSPPFLLSAADNKITMALFPTDSWNRAFKDVLGQDAFKAAHHEDKDHKVIEWGNWDAHHLVPSTVLTHALAQGDLG